MSRDEPPTGMRFQDKRHAGGSISFLDISVLVPHLFLPFLVSAHRRWKGKGLEEEMTVRDYQRFDLKRLHLEQDPPDTTQHVSWTTWR